MQRLCMGLGANFGAGVACATAITLVSSAEVSFGYGDRKTMQVALWCFPMIGANLLTTAGLCLLQQKTGFYQKISPSLQCLAGMVPFIAQIGSAYICARAFE